MRLFAHARRCRHRCSGERSRAPLISLKLGRRRVREQNSRHRTLHEPHAARAAARARPCGRRLRARALAAATSASHAFVIGEHGGGSLGGRAHLRARARKRWGVFFIWSRLMIHFSRRDELESGGGRALCFLNPCATAVAALVCASRTAISRPRRVCCHRCRVRGARFACSHRDCSSTPAGSRARRAERRLLHSSRRCAC